MRKKSVIGRSMRERTGVGGFYEALMAMVVVTLGVVLLSASLSIIAVHSGPPFDLRGEAQHILEQVRCGANWTIESGVLDAHRLGALKNGTVGQGQASGFKVVLLEVGGAPRVLLFNGSGPGSDVEVAVTSIPVNLFYSPTDVRAATLSVWAW